MKKIIKKSLPGIFSGLLVGLILAGGTWLWQFYIPEQIITTKIVTPKDGISVPHVLLLNGTYANTHKNSELWLVVQPAQSPSYHPQPSKIPKQLNNTWTAIAYLGSSETPARGENYIIHLVTANLEALNTFKNYLLSSAKRRSWLGLTDLPGGVTVIDSITVIRK